MFFARSQPTTLTLLHKHAAATAVRTFLVNIVTNFHHLPSPLRTPLQGLICLLDVPTLEEEGTQSDFSRRSPLALCLGAQVNGGGGRMNRCWWPPAAVFPLVLPCRDLPCSLRHTTAVPCYLAPPGLDWFRVSDRPTVTTQWCKVTVNGCDFDAVKPTILPISDIS